MRPYELARHHGQGDIRYSLLAIRYLIRYSLLAIRYLLCLDFARHDVCCSLFEALASRLYGIALSSCRLVAIGSGRRFFKTE